MYRYLDEYINRNWKLRVSMERRNARLGGPTEGSGKSEGAALTCVVGAKFVAA